MPTPVEDLRTRLMEPIWFCIEEQIQQMVREGAVDNHHSNGDVVEWLRSFEQEVAQLDHEDRAAIMSVFHKELTLLLIAFQTEASLLVVRRHHAARRH